MMTQFDFERASCVGGSDLPHLLQLPPYGCTRRLWYEKSLVSADFPFAGNAATERGLACEPFAAADFLKEHQNLGLSAPPFRRLSQEHAMVACHADRLVHERVSVGHYCEGTMDGPAIGVLEIKCPSARVYYSGRGNVDPPNEGKIQANYCAGIWGVGRCWVEWFSADAWRSRCWEFAFDPVMFADCVCAAASFWDTLTGEANPYGQLPEDDPRCNRCPWRGKCKGLDLEASQGATPVDFAGPRLVDLGLPLDQVERLALTFTATKAMKDQAEEAHEIVKAQLIDLFPPEGGRVDTPAAVLTYTVSHRKGYTREVKPGVTRTLRVKPTREEPSDVAIDSE